MMEWRDIPGFPGHEVAADGRLRSKVRGIMKQRRSGKTGYLGSCVIVGPLRRNLFAHRAVALAWLAPPQEPGMQVAHLNGDMMDNRVENLAWVTKRENELHKYAHGTVAIGERNPKAKLTATDVFEIRRRARGGVSRCQLAREYGIGKSQASRIVSGEGWRHLLTAAQEAPDAQS